MRTFNYSTRIKLAVLLLILFALFTNSQLVLTSSSFKFLLGKISLFDTTPRASQNTSSTKVEQTVVTPVATTPPIPRDKATLYEKRFPTLVREALPSNATVGYVTDKGGFFASRSDYYLTQYTLAPVIIADNINQELIVGNFSSPAIIQQILLSDSLFCISVVEHVSEEETKSLPQASDENQLILTTPQGKALDFDGVLVEQCTVEKWLLIQDFGDGVVLLKREDR